MKRSPMPKKAKKPSQAWYRHKCVEKAKEKAREVGVCARCGKKRPYQMHGSHIFSEGHYHGMSDMVDNILCLCAQCHMWWHENPIDSTEWVKQYLGMKYYDLREMSRQVIQKDWQKEYEKIKQ